ncbi:M20/M25/M40 family metallo-hydrolase [Nocardioides daphniae]|uniref:M20/M25/M40 family metallo-hydrolase n=1 Tax=Nocardioides daphniae TaxID=402297 RepID=UPI001EE8669F|nr:M20/M25/M40 family metallo-hydrolase [Nocardioides daphniae]
MACLGSRLATGAWSWEEARKLRDRDGVWLRDAMASVLAHPGGTDADHLTRRDPHERRRAWVARVAAYVELHVEQGRDLVERGAAVGLGSGIWPHGRYRFDFTGQANHAGTTRMEDRHDPMLTYAMTALAANKQARLGGHRATFGRIEVAPNGTNAVPSRVTAWLDARAATTPALQELVATVSDQAEQRAGRDGTALVVTPESVSAEVTFDAALTELAGEGHRWPVIPTAAGHDAGVVAQAGVPTAMLFVRNPTGISHSPDERAETEDCLAGVEALADVLERLLR